MQFYHIIPILSHVWWFLVPKKTSNHMQHMHGPRGLAAMTWPLDPQVKFRVLQSHSFDPYAACLHWEHQECPQNSKSQGLEPPELGIWCIFWGEHVLSVFFGGSCIQFTVCFVMVFFPLFFWWGKTTHVFFSKGDTFWTTKSFSA